MAVPPAPFKALTVTLCAVPDTVGLGKSLTDRCVAKPGLTQLPQPSFVWNPTSVGEMVTMACASVKSFAMMSSSVPLKPLNRAQ